MKIITLITAIVTFCFVHYHFGKAGKSGDKAELARTISSVEKLDYKQKNLNFWSKNYSDLKLVLSESHYDYYSLNEGKNIIVYSHIDKRVINIMENENEI